MSASPTTTAAPPSSFIPQPSSFPPSPRDFLAYERLIIDGLSTRQAAEELKISQTRVRQIVRRVADWLAENLPAHDETRQAAQLRLAQHIASERLHRYSCDCERAWQRTHETKYLSILIRLLTAQSKLPAHPLSLLSLATDDGESGSQPAEPQSGIGFQPVQTEERTTEQACEASAGPPTPARSASEGKPPSTPPNSRAASAASTTPHFELRTPHSSPPPSRACSPQPRSANSVASENPPPQTLTPPLPTTSPRRQPEAATLRQSFLSPAQPSCDATITELTINPQSIGLTQRHSTRRDRRRLQRLLTKK